MWPQVRSASPSIRQNLQRSTLSTASSSPSTHPPPSLPSPLSTGPLQRSLHSTHSVVAKKIDYFLAISRYTLSNRPKLPSASVVPHLWIRPTHHRHLSLPSHVSDLSTEQCSNAQFTSNSSCLGPLDVFSLSTTPQKPWLLVTKRHARRPADVCDFALPRASHHHFFHLVCFRHSSRHLRRQPTSLKAYTPLHECRDP